MTIDLAKLRSRYSELDDASIRQDLLRGPKAFSTPAVWDLLVDEARRRGFPAESIPSGQDDPLVALASFNPNVEVTDGPFERAAQFREDSKLVLLRTAAPTSLARDNLEVFDLPRSVLSFDVIKRGIAGVGRSFFAGVLGAALLHITKLDVTTFTLTLVDGRRIVGRADAQTAKRLEHACMRD